jgi:hypothetical protein
MKIQDESFHWVVQHWHMLNRGRRRSGCQCPDR